MSIHRVLIFGIVWLGVLVGSLVAGDHLRDLQTAAIENGKSPVGHWGGVVGAVAWVAVQ